MYRPKIMHHSNTWHHDFSPHTFNYLCFQKLSIEILILRVFVAQMSTHAASWQDQHEWTHSTCPENHNFPNMLCRLSRDLEYPQCPEYVYKDIIENEELVYEVNVYLTPVPERSYVFHESGPTLRETYEKVALTAITELCERHMDILDASPAAYLPVRHQAGPWRERHEQMMHNYGRSVAERQLVTTAEYALNLYNLKYDQKLELQHLQQQIGHLQAENANLVGQVQAAEVQNEELQHEVNQLDHQLQHILLNDGINMQIHVNEIEPEEEPEEEHTEIQGESGIVSGFVAEPEPVDGAYVAPVDGLPDTESSVNQPPPAAPEARDLMVFPEEMYDQMVAGARHLGFNIERIFSFYPPPRQ